MGSGSERRARRPEAVARGRRGLLDVGVGRGIASVVAMMFV